MEQWDLFDAERKPLGRTHVRGEKFGEGEYYVCCEIWVVNSEGQYLDLLFPSVLVLLLIIVLKSALCIEKTNCLCYFGNVTVVFDDSR